MRSQGRKQVLAPNWSHTENSRSQSNMDSISAEHFLFCCAYTLSCSSTRLRARFQPSAGASPRTLVQQHDHVWPAQATNPASCKQARRSCRRLQANQQVSTACAQQQRLAPWAWRAPQLPAGAATPQQQAHIPPRSRHPVFWWSCPADGQPYRRSASRM